LTGTGVPATHSVTLSWSAAASTVIGYNIYSSTVAGGPYTQLNSTLITTTQYVDSTVQGGQTYYFVATSVDPSNDQSGYSNIATATIPSP
jgi:fibronectin type 3 domain-containing protein